MRYIPLKKSAMEVKYLKYLSILVFLCINSGVGGDEIGDLKATLAKLQNQFDSLEHKYDTMKDEVDQVKNRSVDCGNGWIGYSDTKCFKVLDISESETEAKAKCTQLDASSTLITIDSINEQNFLSNLLKIYRNIADGVWIGLEYSDKSFKWLDKTELKYENWGENAIKDGNEKCVQMSLTEHDLGKWDDDLCQKKYLVACQTIQTSHHMMNEQIQRLTSTIETMKASLESSQLGKGFVYIQLANQPSAKDIWPGLNWTDVTSKYAGLFFRAEGAGSAQFGETQEQQDRNIAITTKRNIDPSHNSQTYYDMGTWHDIDDKADKYYHVGDLSTTGDAFGFKVKLNPGEIRPKNQAIRIWQRT